MAVFNINAYNTVPTVNAALTIAFVRRLIAEMPAGMGKPVNEAAARMRERTDTLRAERLKVRNAPPKVDARVFDQGEDNAWRALHGRLESYARLDTPEGARAAAMIDKLFPKGLDFLGLRFKQQWEESNLLLGFIADNKLAKELDTLCGAAFLQAVQAAHDEYGEALGLTRAKPPVEEVAIGDAFVALRTAIRFYVRRVVSLADEEDPASLELVAGALAPIIELQDETRRRRASGEPDPEPADEGELPPVPAG